ncbi:MAG: hypothetical protein AAF333_03765 [Planctomycetota bacterium]
MTTALDDVMERASQKLADMDYLASEALCLQALRIAREAGDWNGYARVLLPLQECRRQRRMIAADTAVQLGTNACWNDPAAGCVAVTHPLDAESARQIAADATEHGKHVEVLWCDNAADAATWTVKTFAGPAIACDVAAPSSELVSRKLTVGQDDHAPAAAHWFIAASEGLGDAALAAVDAEPGGLGRVEQLEAMVAAVSDHELLHQALGEAARAAAESAAS